MNRKQINIRLDDTGRHQLERLCERMRQHYGIPELSLSEVVQTWINHAEQTFPAVLPVALRRIRRGRPAQE